LITSFENRLYPVMEHFYTIQGEGVYTGYAAYFIRLGGCDVGCPWCDVKESWPMTGHELLSAEYLAETAAASGAPIAVITGGEPLLHQLDSLTAALRVRGLRTHLETSGSAPFSGLFDWVTLSPKRYKAPLDEVYPKVSELKVVIASRQDFRWAEKHASKVSEYARLLLQPEWDTKEAAGWITEYVMQHPQWSVSLQTHKFLGIR
jgi:organic radical activating enzyme